MLERLLIVLALTLPAVAEETARAPVAQSPWIGVVVSEARNGGVAVVLAIDDGPGHAAGLRVGDVILRVADRPVRHGEDFRAVLRARGIGEQLPILIRRDGQERSISVLTAGRPRPQAPVRIAQAPRPSPAPQLFGATPGVTLQPLTPELRRHFGAPAEHGLLVTRVERGGLGERLGLAVGDVLTGVSGEPVSDPARALARLMIPVPELEVAIVRAGRERSLATEQPRPRGGSVSLTGLAQADRARQRALLRSEIERLESRLKVLRERLARLEPE